MDDKNDKIRLGISSCLLGAQVRYDGGHQLDRFLRDVLGDYVEYVPVCPEVEVGLPIPRDTLRLVENAEQQVRLVFSRSGEDITERMEGWARERVRQLEKEQLDGFVFKAKSPSSGMERVKLYDRNGVPKKVGVGVFARHFMEHFPLLPVEEDGRLNDPRLRENFITAIFVLKRWRQLLAAGFGLGRLVEFHTRHKLLIMAHSPQHYRQMGKLVAAGKDFSLTELRENYLAELVAALRLKTTVKKQVNVMQHILGYFKRRLAADEKQEVLELMEHYRQGLVPLIVPLTLLNHFVRKYDQAYLRQQYYLNPHPKELKLLNQI
ncbi:YbgA family protein [Pelovirga terrestris]|uniref:DUF523 and DUF1722 domain-containing protein n=1 Tax=Pelovirga terrestris TaxID=2771352 RepID=A0A8J6UI58_9BACT|nr:DUF523 and DUF1722 domain-containing protein [Pelovirga terrestris]MBD1400275.1 DUF523 and DUF1722 domain-containing protein [Pelovirga terrestris]